MPDRVFPPRLVPCVPFRAFASASGLTGRWDELQRQAVVAPALAGRRRPVIENMSLMPAAARAVILGPRQDKLEVLLGREMPRNTGKKARPSSAAIEFHLRGKQRQRTSCADENPRPLFVVERTRERPFGGFLAQHGKLGLGQRLLPFRLRPLNRRRGLRDVRALGKQRLPILLDFGQRWCRLGIGWRDPARPSYGRYAERHSPPQPENR